MIVFVLTIMWNLLKVTAQVPYHPFLKEGKTWSCSLTERTSENVGNVNAQYVQTTLYILRIDGDTVIGEKTYKKVYKDIITVDRELLYTIPETAAESMERYEHKDVGTTSLYTEFLREEDKMVYTRMSGDRDEKVIYDFSIAAGEATKDYYLGPRAVVSIIDTIVAKGQCFRRYHLDFESYNTEDKVWVEGIGHPGGPFRVWGTEMNNGKTYMLLSCHEDGKCVFTKDDFSNLSVTDGIEQTEIVVEKPRKDGHAYDLQGRRVAEGKSLQPGVYVKDGRKVVVDAESNG